ncbi:MAG TPA: hypothetical protein VII34_05715, partial [Pyrinomonadaceae bacterium]
MNPFDDPAILEALRRAQEMDTPAMREAIRRAEQMNTPAMRETMRRAEQMDTPAMREALRRAEQMDTPTIREANRRAIDQLNNPAISEAQQKAMERLNNPAIRAISEAESRAFEHFNNPAIQNVLNSLRQQEYWQTQPRNSSWHSFFSSPAFNATNELIRQRERTLEMIGSQEWRSLTQLNQHQQDLVERTYRPFGALYEVTRFINDNRNVDFFPHSFADQVLL